MSPPPTTTDPSYPAYPILSFLGFVLVLVPLPWHLQAWNSGTCLFMIWTALGCLNLCINSIVWHANALDKAPVWCDISSRFIVGLAVATPASLLCITRRLYGIAAVQSNGITRADRRRAIVIDMMIGLGLPILQMCLQIIVEGHRYDIFEDVGCRPALFHTPPAYPITLVWPLVIGLISLIYSALTLHEFIRRRAQFNQFIAARASITTNRYLRLMALSMTEILFNTPLSAIGLYLNYISNPIQPWKGWADAHFDYSAVDLIPALVWRSDPLAVLGLELSRWSPVFCAFLFFAFFGFAEEARKNYRNLYRGLSKRLESISPMKFNNGSSGMKSQCIIVESCYPGTLPVFVRPSADLSRAPSFVSSGCLSSTEKSELSLCDLRVSLDPKIESQSVSAMPASPSSSQHTQHDNVDTLNQISPEAVLHSSTSLTSCHIQCNTTDIVSRSSLYDEIEPGSTSPSTASCTEQFVTIEVASPTSVVTFQAI